MYRKQLLIVGFIVLSLTLTVIAPAMAQDSTATPQPTAQAAVAPALTASTGFFATADFRVNVRSGPGTEYTILGKAFSGDALDITGRTADNRWLRVNFNGQEGWVSATLFSVTGDVATAPESVAGTSAVLRQAASTSGSTGTTSSIPAGSVVVITRVNANLRAAPSSSSDLLGVIPFSTTLEVLARSEANNWVQVTYDGKTGWVSSGLLFFQSGNIDTVNPLDASGNPIPTAAAPTAQPTAVPTTAP